MMESILQQLQRRLSEAERRVNEAGAALQEADRAYNVAVNERNVWRLAIEAEARAQQAGKSGQTVFTGMEQLVAPPGVNDLGPGTDNGGTPPEAPSLAETAGGNKTELIRSILRQNPAGLTPPQIWEQVSGQFKHRPYMYSVLKRLKDHDEVVIRRHKYALKPEPDVVQISRAPIVLAANT